MLTSNIIFDLDGTLIDSKTGIIESIKYSLNKNDVINYNLSNIIIGPPIHSIFNKLLNSDKNLSLNQLVSDFRNHHDENGWKKFTPYKHANELLLALKSKNISTFLATSKPGHVTEKIINTLMDG